MDSLSFLILGVCIIMVGVLLYKVYLCQKEIQRCDYTFKINNEFFSWVEAGKRLDEKNERRSLRASWDVEQFIEDLKGPTTFEEVLKELRGSAK